MDVPSRYHKYIRSIVKVVARRLNGGDPGVNELLGVAVIIQG